MKINDAIFGVLLAVLGAAILVHVQAFPKIPGQQVGPALFPGLVAAGLVACGVLLIVSGVRRRGGERWVSLGDWMGSGRHVGAFVVVVAGMVAYILWADNLGFLVISPILLFVWFLALRVRPLTAFVTAVIVALVIWYAFYKLLRVPLPWGVLQPWAF